MLTRAFEKEWLSSGVPDDVCRCFSILEKYGAAPSRVELKAGEGLWVASTLTGSPTHTSGNEDTREIKRRPQPALSSGPPAMYGPFDISRKLSRDAAARAFAHRNSLQVDLSGPYRHWTVRQFFVAAGKVRWWPFIRNDEGEVAKKGTLCGLVDCMPQWGWRGAARSHQWWFSRLVAPPVSREFFREAVAGFPRCAFPAIVAETDAVVYVIQWPTDAPHATCRREWVAARGPWIFRDRAKEAHWDPILGFWETLWPARWHAHLQIETGASDLIRIEPELVPRGTWTNAFVAIQGEEPLEDAMLVHAGYLRHSYLQHPDEDDEPPYWRPVSATMAPVILGDLELHGDERNFRSRAEVSTRRSTADGPNSGETEFDQVLISRVSRSVIKELRAKAADSWNAMIADHAVAIWRASRERSDAGRIRHGLEEVWRTIEPRMRGALAIRRSDGRRHVYETTVPMHVLTAAISEKVGPRKPRTSKAGGGDAESIDLFTTAEIALRNARSKQPSERWVTSKVKAALRKLHGDEPWVKHSSPRDPVAEVTLRFNVLSERDIEWRRSPDAMPPQEGDRDARAPG
jgi:hypothetical protein